MQDSAALLADIAAGKWDFVLTALKAQSPVSLDAQIDLYEHIYHEMLQEEEIDLAKWLLHSSIPFQRLKEADFSRFCLAQEQLSQKEYHFWKDDAEKTMKRIALGNTLLASLTVAPSQRLLTLLKYSLQYQKEKKFIPVSVKPGDYYDIFKGELHSTVASKDVIPKFSCQEILVSNFVFYFRFVLEKQLNLELFLGLVSFLLLA